jgi:hypothetical protein
MLYINSNNEYPRYYGDIILENPGWTLGDDIPEGWSQVIEVPIPEVEPGQIAEESEPEIINGALYQKWNIRDLTTDEFAALNAPASALAKLDAAGLTDFERKLITLGIVK